MNAPDQLAWELLLDEGRATGLRWDQLVHYPHEGGSVVPSILSLLLRPLARAAPVLPPLCWAMLLFEAASRALEIGIARRLFGFRTALGYALFGVGAVPLLLPWSTLSFGLHAAASVWPFVFLLLVNEGFATSGRAAASGALLGLSLAFSYDSLVLLPAAALLLALEARGTKRRVVAVFIGGFFGVVLLHVGMRLLPHGFELESGGPFSIRGLRFAWPGFGATWQTWWGLLTHVLPAASQIPRAPGFATRFAWTCLAYAGLLLTLRRGVRDRAVTLGFVVVATYTLVYAASPLAATRTDGDFITYRHLAYVFPVLALLALRGLMAAGRAGIVAAALFVGLGLAGSLQALTHAQARKPDDRGTGWVVAHKLGHDPARMVRLLSIAAPERRLSIAFGYGWGLASALLDGEAAPAPGPVVRLAGTLSTFPDWAREAARDGVRFAFGPGITPVLDPRLLAIEEEALSRVRAPPAAAP